MLTGRVSVISFAFLAIGFASTAQAQSTTIRPNPALPKINCDYGSTQFCEDRASHKNAKGYYVGHDEPTLVVYSHEPGAGNSAVYLLTLPKDPPTPPAQNGQGGTFNFQLHPTFWAGMAMCDSQSYPEFTTICEPDTDENIFDSADPNSHHFLGNHPGTAFLEMQFYPPGWIGSPQLTDPTDYFAALTIDSFNADGATGALNNMACLNEVGEEPVNFAVITKNGVPLSPANPTGASFGNSNFDMTNVLRMAPGDQVLLVIHDTPAGLEVVIKDLSSGEFGFMVASAANGFGQVLFQPNSATCNVAPYDFHPMYSTSNEHTRVPWAAKSHNTAFADELGHFEYCNLASTTGELACTVPGVEENSSLDSDDIICFGPWDSFFPGPPYQQIGGCTFDDLDFDGSSYGLNWAGTFANPFRDQQLHPEPIAFIGPLFLGPGGLRNYDRVGFETDMADLEGINGTCDVSTGAGCVVPAPGMQFYPIYTTRNSWETCSWQFGGSLIPGTTDTFGGSSTTEYGAVLPLTYQGGLLGEPNVPATTAFVDFHRNLNKNPCPATFGDRENDVNSALQH